MGHFVYYEICKPSEYVQSEYNNVTSKKISD